MPKLDINALISTLQTRTPGPFHFPEIYGSHWDQLYIGDKVKLGHAFMDAVRAGKLPGVTDTGTKKDGGRLYHWAGDGID